MTKTYGIGGSIFAQRNDQILIIKRATGEAKDAWTIPGGRLNDNETIEECATRELMEETGLIPTSPLELLHVRPMFIYGLDSFMISYVCKCEVGEVCLSHEHKDYQWIDPVDYRNQFFADEKIAKYAEIDPKYSIMAKSIQSELDLYIKRCVNN